MVAGVSSNGDVKILTSDPACVDSIVTSDSLTMFTVRSLICISADIELLGINQVDTAWMANSLCFYTDILLSNVRWSRNKAIFENEIERHFVISHLSFTDGRGPQGEEADGRL